MYLCLRTLAAARTTEDMSGTGYADRWTCLLTVNLELAVEDGFFTQLTSHSPIEAFTTPVGFEIGFQHSLVAVEAADTVV